MAHDTAGDESRAPAGGVSRRTILTAAGVAVAGTTLVGPHTVAAGRDLANAGRVAVAAPGVNAVEFRGRISQTGAHGENFVGVGYYTKVIGLDDPDLFAGAPSNVDTALLTLFAAGNLVSRVLDTNVHSLDIEGTLEVHQRAAPGAKFTDPDSFRVGLLVARYEMTLQDVLAVFAPAQGLPTLTGDVHQTLAAPLASGARFGVVGLRSRLLATGFGTLVDPVTLNAQLEMAGNWSLC
jgi:hypothetical protein